MIIRSVNVSEKTGTVKTSRPFVELDASGIKEDAHAGYWHRQVSLLGEEAYQMMNLDPGEFPFGSFAENITTSGKPGTNTPDLKHCKPGDRFRCGDILLEVTQIGKKCHGSGCPVQEKTGNCVMPKEGIFTRVLSGGILKPGDELVYVPKEYRIAVITLSTRAYKALYEDRSGMKLQQMVLEFCKDNNWPLQLAYVLLPDNAEMLHSELERHIRAGYDMIFTTGGTGLGPSDITIAEVKKMLNKEIPGIMEYIRLKYGSDNPNALLSASLAGVAGNSMIFALPGSEKAVTEYFREISRSLKHMVYMRMGLDIH
jgi:molybdenum cofactor synthesis domain-containing protein